MRDAEVHAFLNDSRQPSAPTSTAAACTRRWRVADSRRRPRASDRQGELRRGRFHLAPYVQTAGSEAAYRDVCIDDTVTDVYFSGRRASRGATSSMRGALVSGPAIGSMAHPRACTRRFCPGVDSVRDLERSTPPPARPLRIPAPSPTWCHQPRAWSLPRIVLAPRRREVFAAERARRLGGAPPDGRAS